jgi:hypothetical protein
MHASGAGHPINEEETMSLDDRDYMHERHRSPRKAGPWRNGKLLAKPAPYSFVKKILVFVVAIIALTLFFKNFTPEKITAREKIVGR